MSVHSCPSNPCPICRPDIASKERFVEPAPQPAPSGDDCEACAEDSSFRCDVCGVEFCGEHAAQHKHAPGGDEAKVREIALRWSEKFDLSSGSRMVGAVREACATGKADGAREEREELTGIIAGFVGERERMIKGGHGTKTIIELRVVKQIADAIARRGSEGT